MLSQIHFSIIVAVVCGHPLPVAAESNAPLLQQLQAEEKKVLQMYEDCRRKQDNIHTHRLPNPGEGVDALPIDIFQQSELSCRGFLSVLERNRQAQQILRHQPKQPGVKP
jgi:hypothetical protein